MARICEHEFEMEDPHNKGYSQMEYDLYGKLDMTIRKNLKTTRFEVVKISNKEVQYSYRQLKDIVRIANQLEGAENTIIECGPHCPLKRKDG